MADRTYDSHREHMIVLFSELSEHPQNMKKTLDTKLCKRLHLKRITNLFLNLKAQ